MNGWMIVTEWLERGVLLTLLGLSVWSVSIMIDRWKYFRKLDEVADSGTARKLIESKDLPGLKKWLGGEASHPVAGTIRAAMATEGGGIADHSEAVDRAVRSYLAEERSRMDRGLTVLATLGSNAPFIGLFGTVLGIIKAFGGLADANAAGAQSVMASISFALVATAIGLFVAIPAVVAYNVFNRRLRRVMVECEIFRDLYLSRF